MKPDLNHLASIYNDVVELVHVNVTENDDALNDCVGSKFPTYVLFERGQEEPSFVGSFPISRDRLEAEMLALLAFSDD